MIFRQGCSLGTPKEFLGKAIVQRQKNIFWQGYGSGQNNFLAKATVQGQK
jgi:hypothetical protein